MRRFKSPRSLLALLAVGILFCTNLKASDDCRAKIMSVLSTQALSAENVGDAFTAWTSLETAVGLAETLAARIRITYNVQPDVLDRMWQRPTISHRYFDPLISDAYRWPEAIVAVLNDISLKGRAAIQDNLSYSYSAFLAGAYEGREAIEGFFSELDDETGLRVNLRGAAAALVSRMVGDTTRLFGGDFGRPSALNQMVSSLKRDFDTCQQTGRPIIPGELSFFHINLRRDVRVTAALFLNPRKDNQLTLIVFYRKDTARSRSLVPSGQGTSSSQN